MSSAALIESKGSYEVTARIDWLGNDLVVNLTGGESHVGAVAVAWVGHNPSHAADHVIALPGHKEDIPAREMAEGLSRALGCTVTVVAGMHWDNIDDEGITVVLALCRRITDRIAANAGNRTREEQ